MSTLRHAGWCVPSTLRPETLIKVYGTRLDPEWLRRLFPEVGYPDLARVHIGGDFLTEPRPMLEDQAAMDPVHQRP